MFTSWGRQNTYSRWDTGAIFVGAHGGRNKYASGRCWQRNVQTGKNPLASDQQRWDAAHLILLMRSADTRSNRRRLPAVRHTQYHHYGHARLPAPEMQGWYDTPRPRVNVTVEQNWDAQNSETKNATPRRFARVFVWGFCFIFLCLWYCSTVFSLLGLQHSLLH